MTAENHSVKDSTSLHQLTFHIVDSAMGAGKSESLLDRARAGPGPVQRGLGLYPLPGRGGTSASEWLEG